MFWAIFRRTDKEPEIPVYPLQQKLSEPRKPSGEMRDIYLMNTIKQKKKVSIFFAGVNKQWTFLFVSDNAVQGFFSLLLCLLLLIVAFKRYVWLLFLHIATVDHQQRESLIWDSVLLSTDYFRQVFFDYFRQFIPDKFCSTVLLPTTFMMICIIADKRRRTN